MTDCAPNQSVVYGSFELHCRDGIAEITLSRPDLHNRVDALLHAELTTALDDVRRNPDIRVVILGSTGKVFSAGGDFAMMERANRDPVERRAIVEDGRRLVDAMLSLPQPIIAAVQGPAIGLGATLVLLCDVVVAAKAATLTDSHVAVGLVAGDGGCLAWPQAGGMLRARRHLLTGDPLDAQTAYALGMVTDLAETAEDCMPRAREIASRIAELAPLAVMGTKRALNKVSHQRATEVIEFSLAFEEQTLASEDLIEGITAFRERRRPSFKGR